MSRKYTRHTKESLEPICKESISYREVLGKLGLRCTGGNYKNLQHNIDKFNIDISHMKHQAHNQGKELVPFESLTKIASIKARLFAEGHTSCDICGIKEWNGRSITLELDHVNGDNRNHSRENLRILCPNCHSQTPTYRNRKRQVT